jgi:hypothetical protein
MSRKLFLFLICNLFVISLSSQTSSLPIQKEFQASVNRAYRTLDGKPGQNYWQNEVRYKIEADFNPETGKLSGKEFVYYKNNSPSTLYSLVINLYPNLFEKGNLRDREVNKNDIHDGVKIKSINVEGNEINPLGGSCHYEGTILRLSLPKPLWRKDKILLEIEWEFTMPAKTQIRVGKYSDKTWFIGYWYPQIAVFDDLYGWDEIPYDGLHEFYSAFADFDVKITTPAKNLVWATGVWQNPDSVLNKQYLDRYKKALNSSKVVKIVEEKDLYEDITQSATTNTWYFKAENVTDFSFATSDHYLWDGLSVVVDKKSKQETFIQTAYSKNALDFYEVANISKKTIEYLSESMPGIPFPYPRMTVFNGGGGMEFPMMVNDRSCNSASATLNLTSHEIAHTYFPFYMGINQERFSWMDEGMAQFLPAEFQNQQLTYNDQATQSAYVYAMYAGSSLEMPMMVPSYFMKGYEYYVDSYYRPELAYRTLQNLLGEELFLKALQEFIKRWNGKYPCPYDFFFTVNDVAEEDLAWFWKPWFFEIAWPDLGIAEVLENNGVCKIQVKNKGGLPLPVEINIKYKDGSSDAISKSAKSWQFAGNELIVEFKTKKEMKEITLGNSRIPDTFKSDNRKVF